MPACYRCGRPLAPFAGVRRRLKTGEWLRRSYPKRAVRGVNVHFGLRVVCPACARSLDREALIRELLQYWEIWFALIFALAVLLARLLP